MKDSDRPDNNTRMSGPPHRTDPAATRELFVAQAPFVARFLLRIGVARADVDDLVQEVFMVAHRGGGFVPERGRPTTWLASIALRVASNARRSIRRRRETHDDDALSREPAAHCDPHTRAEVAESLARVERALETLEIDQRAIFVLFEVEGEDCEAIGLGLGIPVGTVYSRLHRARREFQRAYDRQTKARRAAPHFRRTEGALR